MGNATVVRDLEGKVALVTGATSGIGQAAAVQLAAQGATVIVHGRDASRGAAVVATIENSGGAARFVAADLVEPAEAIRLAGEVGDVDILVNNAGRQRDLAGACLHQRRRTKTISWRVNTPAIQRINMTWRVPSHLTEPPKPREPPAARLGRAAAAAVANTHTRRPDQHFTETIQGVSNVTHDQIL